MSSVDTTVIICCAGMGTRLGIGTTKALLHNSDRRAKEKERRGSGG